MSDEQILLRPLEAAKRLAISERKLWSLTASGVIPCLRLGKLVRYRPASLAAWAESHEAPCSSQAASANMR